MAKHERYVRFKLETPKTVTKKKDLEVYRKLEYLGPVMGDLVKQKYLRRSIKSPWERFIDSREYINNRDELEKNPIKLKDVQILEDLTYDEFLEKYFEHIFI